MSERLKGKVALITGASSGIGAATAKLFAREGARVVAADIRYSEALQVVSDILNSGGDAIAVEVDVSNPSQVKKMIEKTIEKFGSLSILVCNAAVLHPGSVTEIEVDDWNRTINVNLSGSFLCSKYGIPEIKKSGGGSVIITSSTVGFAAEKGIAAYGASKGALIILTKLMALDYVKDGIRVNCVCPGWVDTPFNDPIIASEGLSKESISSIIPMGRQATPEETAQATLYLVSDDASYITGHVLVIDGGLSIQ